MRHGQNLPVYPERRSEIFAHAPVTPAGKNPEIDAGQLAVWERFYGSLVTRTGMQTAPAAPPARPPHRADPRSAHAAWVRGRFPNNAISPNQFPGSITASQASLPAELAAPILPRPSSKQ